MQLNDFLQKMTPNIYNTLKESIEIRKWPNGKALTDEEQATSLQILIAWEAENLPEEQRSGYMPAQCQSKNKKTTGNSILRFKN